VRLDPEVLEWLRSKGEGHLTRINDILTNLMEAERKVSRSASQRVSKSAGVLLGWWLRAPRRSSLDTVFHGQLDFSPAGQRGLRSTNIEGKDL
jgi:hypothetical protein